MRPLINYCWSFVFLLLLFGVQSAQATWSIVAVDVRTGEVGGASATCTPYAYALFGIVPGTGIIVTQAASNPVARLKGMDLLKQGADPQRVVAAITDPAFDPTHAEQQHGVVTLGFGQAAAGYTGSSTAWESGDLQGKGVSVQGNILAGSDVLPAALKAFEASRLDPSCKLAESLLAALEAASVAGGDRRCGAQTAISAYLVVARPGDSPEFPFIQINVLQFRGGNNPVTLLREMYENHDQR